MTTRRRHGRCGIRRACDRIPARAPARARHPARDSRGSGLEARLVPVADGDAFANWLQVVARGFLDGERSDEQVAAIRERSGYRRMTGIYDPTAPMPEAPVATIASWIGELTVPGRRRHPVLRDLGGDRRPDAPPTRHRAGDARGRARQSRRPPECPMAMLTVSESHAVRPLRLRAGRGERVVAHRRQAGVVDRPATATAASTSSRASGCANSSRRCTSVPGSRSPARSTCPPASGTPSPAPGPTPRIPGNKRAIQYADETGEVRGVALYSVRENHEDFTKATVTVSYLLAETDDAYAALWRFFVELDLVGEVRADELSVDEPLLWMISDQRAATVTVSDHQYVRILDVPAALEARTFGAPGSLLLDVSDPLGYAQGRWLLDVDATGRGTVTPWASRRAARRTPSSSHSGSRSSRPSTSAACRSRPSPQPAGCSRRMPRPPRACSAGTSRPASASGTDRRARRALA